MTKTLEGLQEQLEEQQKQIEILQRLVLEKVQRQAHDEEEGYIVVRNNTQGWITLQHPNIEYRGVQGDEVIDPYSERALPAIWKHSPTIAPATEKGYITVGKADEIPVALISRPSLPEGYDHMPPMHRRLALDIAQQGADGDEGDAGSYPKTVYNFLMMDQETNTGRTDVQEMQEVVLPILELAAWYERNWRNREWVLDLLDDRARRIRNMTRLGA